MSVCRRHSFANRSIPLPSTAPTLSCNRKSAGGMHLETLDAVLGRAGGGPGGEEETRLFLLRKSFFFKTR